MFELFMQLSTFLGVWLVVGFAVALKIVVLERRFKESNRENLKKERKGVDDDSTDAEIDEILDNLISNNRTVFTVLTLGGFVSFYLDTKGTFRKRE